MEEQHRKKRRRQEKYQHCTDVSGAILYLRALQGHSGRNLVDPSLQDSVLIPDVFFKYIYHVGCAINLHSIINSGLKPGGQNLSKRQTVFFLLVDPMDNEHKDPDTIDLGAPRLARYMHRAWKKHQNTENCSKERIEVLSDSIERDHSLQYTPSLLNPESCSDGNWRHHLWIILITSNASEDFLKTWMQELGSEVARQAEVNQPTQPNPNPNHDRTVRPFVPEQTSRSSAQEIDTRFSRDCKNTNLFVERLDKDKNKYKNVDADRDRTGRPLVSGQPTGLFTQLEEVDIDFRCLDSHMQL